MNDKKRVFSKSHIHTHNNPGEYFTSVLLQDEGIYNNSSRVLLGQSIRTGFFVLFNLPWAQGFCPGFLAHPSWSALYLPSAGTISPGPSPSRFLSLSSPYKPPPLGFVDTFPSSLELSPDSAWVGQDSLGPDWESHLLFLHRCVVVSVLPSHKQRLSPVTLQKLAEISPNPPPNTGSSSQLSYDFLQYPHSIARADDLSTILILHAQFITDFLS